MSAEVFIVGMPPACPECNNVHRHRENCRYGAMEARAFAAEAALAKEVSTRDVTDEERVRDVLRTDYKPSFDVLMNLIRATRANEKEACAKVAGDWNGGYSHTGRDISAEIRARRP